MRNSFLNQVLTFKYTIVLSNLFPVYTIPEDNFIKQSGTRKKKRRKPKPDHNDDQVQSFDTKGFLSEHPNDARVDKVETIGS